MFGPAVSPPRTTTLVLLTALSVLLLNMFLPSLSNIVASFQADYALVSLSIGGYLAMTAVLQLIVGPMSDRYGRRPVLLAALSVFTAASVGCFLAGDVWVFLCFRMVQGAMISGWVIALAVIRDTVPEREAASRIGYVTMAMAVGPMLGPVFGGALDALFGWRSNFLAFAGLGAAAIVLCWVDLGETNKTPSETFAKQFRTYPELFRSRRFWGYALCMMSSTGAFYVFLAGAPLVAETALALSPATVGLFVGSITGGFLMGGFFSGRFAKRFALTTMMMTGRLVACAGLVAGLATPQGGLAGTIALCGAVVLVGLGNGLTMPACNAGVMSVRPRLAGSASGMSGSMTVTGGAVLSAVAGAMVTEANAAGALLGLMLACAAFGLLATVSVIRVDRREGAVNRPAP